MSKSHLAAAALSLLLLSLPLAGVWLTEAPWLWPVLTLTLLVPAFFLTGVMRRKAARTAVRLLVVNGIFLVNTAFFLSYYMQNQGFNDVFFYHAQPDVVYAGLSEFLSLALLTIGILLLANMLTPLADRAGAWRTAGTPLIAGWSTLGIGSLILFPPVISLIAHAWPDALPRLPAGLLSRTAPVLIAMPNSERILNDLADRPRLAGTGDGKPPHLILLYLESVERRYFDQSLFPDLLPELTALRRRSLDFPNMFQAPGTGWTIAGMTASQCGYPLMSSFRGGANDLGILPTFLPDAVCFGDLLEDAGYALTYLGGADHRFAGKGNFYRSHGFDEVYGFDDLKDRLADPGYRHHWGLFDDTVLDLAHDRFLAMADSGQPAALVLLTLDTHHPEGFPSATCKPYDRIDNAILHAVHCTDQLVADFVRRIRASAHADDTYIVIASDHLAMRNSATGMLRAKGGERRLTFFIDTPNQSGGRSESTGLHYDMIPTLLDLVGIEIEGQIGLGRSLLHQDGYLPATVGIDTAISSRPDRKLGDHIAALWSLNAMTVSDGAAVDLEEGSITFGDRTFDLKTKHSSALLPTLLTFDKDRLRLTGLHQANPGEDDPDQLSARMTASGDALHIAIGPYAALESAVEAALTKRPAEPITARSKERLKSVRDEDLLIYLGHPDGRAIVARPASGRLNIPGRDVRAVIN